MHQSQVAVLAIVREFAVHAFGKTAFVTGGYPRDLHYGRKPTDVDITIPLGDYDEALAFASAEFLCNTLASTGATTSISQAYSLATADFDSRIHVLIEVRTKDGQEVDIMFSRSGSLSHVLAGYDSNINQVWLDSRGVPIWAAGHPPVECVALKELTAERIERIHQVATEIGLPIVAESFTAKPQRELDYEDGTHLF